MFTCVWDISFTKILNVLFKGIIYYLRIFKGKKVAHDLMLFIYQLILTIIKHLNSCEKLQYPWFCKEISTNQRITASKRTAHFYISSQNTLKNKPSKTIIHCFNIKSTSVNQLFYTSPLLLVNLLIKAVKLRVLYFCLNFHFFFSNQSLCCDSPRSGLVWLVAYNSQTKTF